MLDGIQYPNNVTLTLVLGKSFDITYVRLKFISPRPESFAIYKKTTLDGEWIPWQYYSGSCKSTYKLPEKAPILPGNEAVAQCTREFSDISPLTGGNIAFSTLDGRPSAENFEESEVLQEWVTAVAIRVVLNRLNTFGDEVFGDPRVLKTYYYAISDFTVGGRYAVKSDKNVSFLFIKFPDVNATVMQTLVWHQQERELPRPWFVNANTTPMVRIVKNVIPSSKIDLGGGGLTRSLMNVYVSS